MELKNGVLVDSNQARKTRGGAQDGVSPSQAPSARPEHPDVTSERAVVEQTLHGSDPKKVAGRGGNAAIAESHRAYGELVKRDRRSALVVAVGGFAIALATLSAGLSIFSVERRWHAPSLTCMFAAAGVILVTMVMVGQLLGAASRFQRKAWNAFDPVVQDGVLKASLDYGRLWSDGTEGRFLHRSTVRMRIDAAAFEGGTLRLGAAVVKRSQRRQDVIAMAADLAIDRWCEIGLIAAAPLADSGEQRFVFEGDIVADLRSK